MFGKGLGFDLYVMEKEGAFDSEREKKINNAINEFQRIKCSGRLSNDVIEPILNKYGLSESDLTDAECEKINSKVMGNHWSIIFETWLFVKQKL